MADKLDTVPAITRTAARQVHRNNVPETAPKGCYRQALAIPPLVTLIAELGFRLNFFLQFYVAVHSGISWMM